jgi:vacuolar-type H+-ATPase subunit E/Vma4
MGNGELIEALRRQGEENIRTICQEAEAEAGRIRGDAAGRISGIRESLGKAHSAAVKEQTGPIISEADRKARMVMLSAEKELSDRLYAASVKALVSLREQRYPEVFDALAHELPSCHWQVVRVHPDDEERARGCFPGSEIVSDESITAGLDVVENEGKIRVVNTFEKRLENAWIEILPELIKDVYGKIAECGVPEKN